MFRSGNLKLNVMASNRALLTDANPSALRASHGTGKTPTFGIAG